MEIRVLIQLPCFVTVAGAAAGCVVIVAGLGAAAGCVVIVVFVSQSALAVAVFCDV